MELRNNGWLQKLKRTIGGFFPVSEKRRGKCNHCGACCALIYGRCIFLKDGEDGKQYCRIYKFRPFNCRKYPRTEGEQVPVETCGFYFEHDDDASESR